MSESETTARPDPYLADVHVYHRTGELSRPLFGLMTRVSKFVANRLVPDATDREDAAQEGLAGLARALATYVPAGGASVATYCRRVAWRRILTFLKGSRKHAHLRGQADPEAVPSQSPGVGHEFELADDFRRVVDAIQQLDANDRLLVEFIRAGATAANMAESLGCSVVSARMRKHRLLLKLRDLLAADAE